MISGLGRSHGEGNGNPLQYPGLEKPMDRETWWATAHGVTELDTTQPLTQARCQLLMGVYKNLEQEMPSRAKYRNELPET